jgi:hypothetical protein
MNQKWTPQLCAPLCCFVAILVFPAFSAQPQSPTAATVTLVAQAEPQKLFGGGQRPVSVMWRNFGDRTANVPIFTRLYQTSSSTAIPLSETNWKTLEILAGQTVLETAMLDLPAVRAETRFLVQWLQASNIVLGNTEVWIYPTNQLDELRVLADGTPLGIFDPHNRLKPLLHAVNVDFADIETIGSREFSGHLAIFGPFESKVEVREELPTVIESLARRGVSVVWIFPALEPMLKPSFYLVPIGKGVVVVAAHYLSARLDQRPESQLNLVELCRLALHPKPFSLPSQP